MNSKNIQTRYLSKDQIRTHDLSYEICKNYFLTSLIIAWIKPETSQSPAIVCSINQLNNLRIIAFSDVKNVNKAALSVLHLSGLAICLSQIKF